MPNVEQARDKQWHPPGDADTDEAIHVDLDETDVSKAVERVPETRGSIAHANDDEESPAERDWLDRSKAVNKRIARMKRNYDQQRAEDHALFQRELTERDKRLAALESGRETRTDASALEAELQSLETQLADAHEKGESREVARITRLIAAKERDIWVAQQKKAAPHQEEREVPAAKDTGKPAPGPTARGQAWIDANLDWWEDEDYAAERFEAVRLHDKMVANGSDPNNPKHYAKLEQKLKAKFPKLGLAGMEPDDDLDEEEEEVVPQRREARRAPVQAVHDRGNNGTQRRAGRGFQLTSAQIANMRRWGLDPNKNADVLMYASNAQTGE